MTNPSQENECKRPEGSCESCGLTKGRCLCPRLSGPIVTQEVSSELWDARHTHLSDINVCLEGEKGFLLLVLSVSLKKAEDSGFAPSKSPESRHMINA